MNKTKKTIYESAMKVFSSCGYSGATMDMIASDAGVAKGTLYYYFKSKQEIFEYIVDEGMRIIKEEIEVMAKEKEDSLEKLKVLCEVQLDLVQNRRDFIKVVLSQFWGEEDRQIKFREVIKGYIIYIQSYINNAMNDRKIKDGDSLAMAYSIFGIMYASATYELFNNNRENSEEFKRGLIDHFLNGIQI
ncbi:TetR/AcrR family transcriptional regulator [Clostridium fermenticellae]|uniref:TetR/AcrR family transcriptional regulator n=1 Tax=Clostridium fermenticellae TaxID=2068654 RepID=A0A386H0G3_9CLOT|nr:TetR/AcrR family transcriptional regulator [Clostridium fermenticellae]AYD39063.1 TetR/AcrR family transcriptional regulator [Clostridium fermenticellae]